MRDAENGRGDIRETPASAIKNIPSIEILNYTGCGSMGVILGYTKMHDVGLHFKERKK
jgi:hypothetical protein